MFRSIYWKITVPLILLVIVGMGILGFILENSVRNAQLEHLQEYLTNEARLVAEDTLPGLIDPAKLPGTDSVAKTIGTEISARVTIIAKDGTVLGDSWENPPTLENHGSRPEVMDALSKGIGKSTRYSTTTQENMMYVAVPILNQTSIVGVARVALPLTSVENSVNGAVKTTAVAITIAALLGILATSFITGMITRPVRRVTQAASRIAAGQLDQQIEIQSGDELGTLGKAFNKMSSNLNSTMAAISDEKSKLTTILSKIADGVIMTDAKTRVILANTASERLFNFQENKAIEKPLIEVLLNYEIDELLKKCISSGQEQKAQFDTTGGKFLRVIAVPLKTNKISGALLLFQDLTEMRSLQTMRREFVGNVSHELRTPLAVIKAIVETLQGGAINDRDVAEDFLDKVNSEVESLTQMVNELIELSRIETGKTHLNLTPVNLNQEIQEVINHLSPQAERKSVNLVMKLKNELPLVEADRERLNQVVINMVHNAIKFTPSPGKITIESDAIDNSVVVHISDTGIGISKDDLPHIFERFFKADRSRSNAGSGLGLAIAKHIIQAHNGKIWVESQEGLGSTFSFSIPITGPKI